MSSMMMGSEKGGSTQTGKYSKGSARSVEKQGIAFQRMSHTSQQQSFNQTQQINNQPVVKHSFVATNDNNNSYQQPSKASNKKSLMQKAVANQQKHLLQNMNYQVVDQAFLSQLKSANVTVGSHERGGRLVTKTAKSSSGQGARNPVNASGGNNLFEFMSVQTSSGASKGASLGAQRYNFPGGQVSQSTRHAGKNFDKVNFSSTQGTHMNMLAQQNSSSSQRQGDLVQHNSKHLDSRNENSRLLNYEHSNNRISLQTDQNESSSYYGGQTSQMLDQPGMSVQNSNYTAANVMTTKNTTASAKRSSFKSSERTSKVGTVGNLKVQTLGSAGKPDFANLVRQPASTKNNVTKKQLEGQIVSGIISKKTIAESLAKSSIPQKMIGNAGHLSTKSGKTSAVVQNNYINDASLLMQAVSSQMQTPHNQGKHGTSSSGGNQIQNQFSVVSNKQAPANLHKRKASTQSSQQPGGVPSNQRVSHDHHFIVNELKKQQQDYQPGSKFQTHAVHQKGGGTQRAGVSNSKQNSAIKDPTQGKKAAVTTRSVGGKVINSNSSGNNHLFKLKLVDGQSQDMGPMMFENYAGQPVTATNQQRAGQKVTQLIPTHNKKGSSVGKSTKSQERKQTHVSQHTGQKSVTNKYTKILASVDDFDGSQIHVPVGVSSATNKIKKSFNFEQVGPHLAHQEMASIDNQSSGAHDTSGTSRTKKQELMNQILLQNQQLAGNMHSPFMTNASNPPVGMKYLTTGGTSSSAAGSSIPSTTTARQSQKQAKVQNMKTNQLLLLQQQYAQANSHAVGSTAIPTTTSNATGKPTQQSSASNSRKVLFNSSGKQVPQQFQFATQQNGGKNGLSVITKKQISTNGGQGGKVAKSVSQSKPPAHAQYFNSAKMKNDNSQASNQGANNVGEDGSQNRTAITTGNGKTQIEVTGNQMLCLWNVNIDQAHIGQGASTNYIDQKAAFNLPYQMFQNNPNMMAQQPGQNLYQDQAQQQQQNFHPSQQQQPLRQSSSKESISGQQQHLVQNIKVTSGKGQRTSQSSNKPLSQGGQKGTATRQIDINISRKSNEAAQAIGELGIFNKHFKRQAQTKIPLNIRTKKQMSTEAIMQQQMNQTGVSQQTQSTKNNNSQAKQIIQQQHSASNQDNNQSAQNRLVKLLANTAAAAAASSSQQQKEKGVTKSSRTRPKAQNSSSMEQRRSSHHRQPQSRGHSSKKNANQAMMLVTDNRELVEVAPQHMPRVNLSTTNKTTREINLNMLDQRGNLMGAQHTQQLKQMGKLVNNYYMDEQPGMNQESAQQQHKRMQSLMTDPQFITQLGLSEVDGTTHHLMADASAIGKQQYKGHTTKNTSGNPNLFNQDPAFFKKQQQSYQTNTKYRPSKHTQNQQLSQKQQQQKAANAASQMNQLEANNLAALSHKSNYIINTGQNAPKAKKLAVAFNEEDLCGQTEFLQLQNEEDWMRKMEAEWQQTSDINKLIQRDEALANEARFAITSKDPFQHLHKGAVSTTNQQKPLLKTQDVSEILRKAKQDFISRGGGDAGASEPYEEEDDCVVEETDPEEMSYPKHEPAQHSSIHKNKASNLSQHTQSTMQQKPSEKTDTLLKGALLREQQAAQKSLKATEVKVEDEEAIEYPMTVRQALKLYAKTGKLTDFEKTELLDFKKVYFLGLEADKIKGKTSGKLHNNGYDDEQGDYNVILKDHIYYRFEVLDFLGKGSFGQALKCFDHKTGEIIALKIIKNKERYQHQAGVELRILQHLQKQDPDDQNNIIQIKDHCVFRNHLIISFELFSINLYEFVKNNNFQGVSLSLIRRFAIQILQSLKFLRDEDVIHCDLKPENILLKSPDKSGIKIIDFGSSCFSNQRIYSYIQSRFYRAPEIIIGIPYTTGIDMWSFGCILIELYTGIPIFPGESEMEQLALIMQVFGVPPLKVLKNAERKDKFFRPGTNEPIHIIEDTDGSLRLPGSRPLEEIIGDQSETFFDFIVQCLEWDPEERITPFQALQHPWILEGLPRRVLIHHQRMLGLDVPSESEQSQASMPTMPATSEKPAQILNDYGNESSYYEANQSELQTHDDQMLQNQINFQNAGQQQSSGLNLEQANPFEMADGDDYADDINQEMLDVHNRSTQQQQDQPQYLQLPARQIDNGMMNQFQGAETGQQKPGKQELSRTQPMPSHFLQGKKGKQQQVDANQHYEQQYENLNYQSLENGQQMLQFTDNIQQQFNNQQQNSYPINDQMADFMGHEDLVDAEDFQEMDQFNPKSKTTNMSSLLKQINQSIKKAGGGKKQKQYEIETGEEMGANAMIQAPQVTTAGTTRYKLPQSSAFAPHGGSVRGAPQVLSDDFSNHQSQQQESTNVSFLMKHRIRQTTGETGPKSGKSSAPEATTSSTTRTTAAAGGSNHGNNKNVNKIAINTQKEHEMMSDYSVVVPPQGQRHHQYAPTMMLPGADSTNSRAIGKQGQSTKNQHRPQKMLMNNFMHLQEDIL